MNADERFERLNELLDEIQGMSSEYIILIEGKKDRSSLNDLGITSEMIEVQNDAGPLRVAEMVAERRKKGLILTDWDSKGDRIAKELSEQLTALGVEYDISVRKELIDLCIKDIKDVESLQTLYSRLQKETVRSDIIT